MAARRVKLRHDDETRARIQTSQLINRLTSHALGRLKKELSASQVKAIEILLRKTLPDLATIEMRGNDDHPIRWVFSWKGSKSGPSRSTTSPESSSAPSTSAPSASPASSRTAGPAKP
jgi:hypothetical protein